MLSIAHSDSLLFLHLRVWIVLLVPTSVQFPLYRLYTVPRWHFNRLDHGSDLWKKKTNSSSIDQYSKKQIPLTPDCFDQNGQFILGREEKRLCHVVVQVLLLLTRRMQHSRQSDLRGSVQQTGIRQIDLLQEVVNSRSKSFRIVHRASRLNVYEEALDRPEWIVEVR